MKKIFTTLALAMFGSLTFAQTFNDIYGETTLKIESNNSESKADDCSIDVPSNNLQNASPGISDNKKIAVDFIVKAGQQKEISSLYFNHWSLDSLNLIVNSVNIDFYESKFDEQLNINTPGELVKSYENVPYVSRVNQGSRASSEGVVTRIYKYNFNLPEPLIVDANEENKNYWIVFSGANLSTNGVAEYFEIRTALVGNTTFPDLNWDIQNNRWKKMTTNNNEGVINIIANCTDLSIDDFINNKLSIYPNPVQDQLMINGKNVRNVEIFSVNGQKFNVKLNTLSKDKINVDVQSLSKGVYLLMAEIDGKVQTLKFIKK